LESFSGNICLTKKIQIADVRSLHWFHTSKESSKYSTPLFVS